MVFALISNANASDAPMGFQVDNVVLYQPDSVLNERLANVEVLADYLNKQQAICENFFASETAPENLDIVSIIVPGRRVKVWFLSSSRQTDDNDLNSLSVLLEQVSAPEVNYGPIAFAISASIAGASQKSLDEQYYQPPIPDEWREAISSIDHRVVVPDGILDLVWPDHRLTE